MKITGTVIRLGIFSLVLLIFTVMIIVVFGQMRFDRTNGYSAEFSNVSGLRAGQFVRASGVEIGKVSSVQLIDGGKRVRVDFNVDRSVPLYQSTTAQIRYLDLIGNRYLELKRGEGEGADKVLPPGGFIPLSRTSPALDLDALIGGFKPLFRALDPRQGQHHRDGPHHRVPGPGRHHQRHPRPNRATDHADRPSVTRRSARWSRT